MQLKLFDDQTLDQMVEDGRKFLTTRFIELQGVAPNKVDISSYAHKLIMYDMAMGNLEIPTLTMESFDRYIDHVKRINDNDATKVITYLQKDLGDKWEFLYNKDKIREVYPFVR